MTARSILQIVDAPGRIVGGSMLLTRADGAIIDLARLDPRGREIRSRARRRDRDDLPGADDLALAGPHASATRSSRRCGCIRHGQEGSARACVELLRQVEIPDPETAIDRYTFEFSGGMRQRAMIAMALACNPSLLIADEPTTALDVTTQAEILDLIKRLQQQHGMAVMFITHDMGVVAEIADDVLVMYHGKVDGERAGRDDLPRAAARLHPDADRLGAQARAEGGDPAASARRSPTTRRR